jgi:hypothetical protein
MSFLFNGISEALLFCELERFNLRKEVDLLDRHTEDLAHFRSRKDKCKIVMKK